MPNTVLIGAQWGDEGKGKIIDVLTEQADWVVRFQGGNNAGHTVWIGDEKYVLHLIPSGILRRDKRCVIGHGVVVDPLALLEEIDGLLDRGVSMEERFFIADRAHIVFPYHRLIDASHERRKVKGEQIGTTKRGIGPAYADKASRTGLRMADLVDPGFPEAMKARLETNNRILEAMDAELVNIEETMDRYIEAAHRLRPYIADTITLLNEAVARDDRMLFEGAQGTMLDIDYGTYPFVTSSSASAGGAATGAGVAPSRIDRVIGVLKAYTTRVGEGPFPTELHDEIGERLRDEGGEYGATTGRPRRCGWFDAVVARYSATVSGIDRWALTKLDVLDTIDTLHICTAYEINGRRLETIPANVREMEGCRPVYETMPGWQCPTKDVGSFDELPQAARDYIERIENLTGVAVGMLSVGPRRSSTMTLNDREISD